MANQDPLSRLRYFHHASAFGLAGQIDRPITRTIPTQAAVSLAPSGGHGTHRIENFELPGFVSFSAAYVKVGGSVDEDHSTYATYASSVIENLNICGMITADRIVSRLSIYSDVPKNPDQPLSPASFSIVGSYFQNLRIAGRKIDIELATQPFNNETYNDFHGGKKGKGKDHAHRTWMLGSHVADQLDSNDEIKNKALKKKLEHNHRVVCAVGKQFRLWEKDDSKHAGPYWCSAVDAAGLEKSVKDSDLDSFGGIICVPRFGVIYLAELRIHHNHRHLTMLRVHMCSTAGGNVDGGGSGGGGTGSTGP